ncbi:site-specific integrase [Vibrio methylphosphonaticus]|uniref:site-specific integrase n=1 Tax=Vibrio methylphosphonaticus TaxID=2946866 RepID=UPI002029F8AD|nr:site-specific integrase [Vibrio methylphosphonaticus]MCL9774599.1 site-specific integrase [Vibrio methylphosphonaticus]
MYLQKAPNGVYQTRICAPKKLRSHGYPYDFKFSLLTRNRQLAIERNFEIAQCIRAAFHTASKSTVPSAKTFTFALREQVRSIRNNYDENQQTEFSIQEQKTSGYSDFPELDHIDFHTLEPYPPSDQHPISLYSVESLLREFLASKRVENVRALTVHQLEQRISHFLSFAHSNNTIYITSATFMQYVTQLHSEKRSMKTNKDYFASTTQFFGWLYQMDYISHNPADKVSPKFRAKRHASTERDRWTESELRKILTSKAFLSQSIDFQWVTRLQLYHGLRTGEACQFYTNDITEIEGILCLHVNDKSEYQHLKNSHAVRYIPIHPHIREDFIAFVRSRSKRINRPLFRYNPLSADKDWTKTYRTQFGRVQTEIGMKPGQRPTAYGLRHTFIDQLKVADEAEHVVAELVGHTNPNMTFGRYGKKLKVNRLLEAVAKFDLKVEVSHD